MGLSLTLFLYAILMECVCVFRRAFQSSAATAVLASLNTTGERFTRYSHSANTQTGETYSYSCTTLSSYSLPTSSSFSLFQHRRSTTLPYYYHHSILLFPQSCQPVVRQLSVVQCLAFLLFFLVLGQEQVIVVRQVGKSPALLPPLSLLPP